MRIGDAIIQGTMDVTREWRHLRFTELMKKRIGVCRDGDDECHKAFKEAIGAMLNYSETVERLYGPSPDILELLTRATQKIYVDKRKSSIEFVNETDDTVEIHIVPKPM